VRVAVDYVLYGTAYLDLPDTNPDKAHEALTQFDDTCLLAGISRFDGKIDGDAIEVKEVIEVK
jgi:hypothetical protein